MLCYSACPVISNEPDFLGPAAIALGHRYNLDTRDQGQAERNQVFREDETIFGRWVDLLLLGGAALIIVPLSWFRQQEEAPPPRWLVLWLAVSAALAVLAGAQAGAALVPALAVLVANALARRARPDGALRWAGMLVGGQLTLAAVAISLAPADTTFFAALSHGEVQAGDTVIVEDLTSDEAYLLRRRLGATVVDGSPAETTGRVMTLGGGAAASLSLDASTGEVTPRTPRTEAMLPSEDDGED